MTIKGTIDKCVFQPELTPQLVVRYNLEEHEVKCEHCGSICRVPAGLLLTRCGRCNGGLALAELT